MPIRPTANNAEVWIRASPKGTRTGFAVLADGAGGALTVTVLPKPWAPRRGAVRLYEHELAQTTHIVLYETDLACVRTDAAGEVSLSLAKAVSQYPELLGLGAAPERQLLTEATSGDPFGELIQLMVLADRSNIVLDGPLFEGRFAQSLVRLLSQERFLNNVESLIFRARPRYEERTENLPLPRGRLHEQSLLHSLVTGIPRVESTFDELTMDTQLLQVIASALRVIVSDRLPSKIARVRPSIQSRANLLLRHLSSVTLIPRERALVTAERMWLGPLDRAWQPALETAMPVLHNFAVIPESGDDFGDPIVVWVAMEKLWEQCLEAALETAFAEVAVSRDGQPAEGMMVPRPWGTDSDGGDAVELSEAYPDYMFTAHGRVVLADAKYKVTVGDVPGSQDGYQLFTYSHLAKLNSRLSDLAVVLYPALSLMEPRQTMLLRRAERDYPLWMAKLPFPTRSDIASQSSWSAYIARIALILQRFSTEWAAQLDVREQHSAGAA